MHSLVIEGTRLVSNVCLHRAVGSSRNAIRLRIHEKTHHRAVTPLCGMEAVPHHTCSFERTLSGSTPPKHAASLNPNQLSQQMREFYHCKQYRVLAGGSLVGHSHENHREWASALSLQRKRTPTKDFVKLHKLGGIRGLHRTAHLEHDKSHAATRLPPASSH